MSRCRQWHCVSASLQTLLDALWLDFKDIARTARAIDLDEPGFAALYRLPRRTQPATQEGRRHHPCHPIPIAVSVEKTG